MANNPEDFPFEPRKIAKQMSNDPDDFPVFKRLDHATIVKELEKLSKYLHNISEIIQVDSDNIQISLNSMYEIIERIEKRRIYFHIYYDGCKMGELNEVSLMSFWILKLNPFYCEGISNSVLNAKIALCLFINTIYFYANRTGSGIKISEQLYDDIYYAFRFRDLSKEAIMILAESLIIK